MHGILHGDLKAYLVKRQSQEAYDAIIEAAGLKDDFSAESYYDDSLFDRILTAAGAQLSMDRQELLYELGVDLTPGALEHFGPLIDPSWKTLDFVESVESVMHHTAREQLKARPPVLETERVSADKLIVRISSTRNMFGLARGFIQGIAGHYGETVEVDLQTKGNDCTITLERVAPSA